MGSRLKPWLFFLLLVGLNACNDDVKTNNTEQKQEIKPKIWKQPPVFNRDSAFQFVKDQVNFGPRVPGTDAHAACAKFLETTLQRFGAQVMVQKAPLTTFDKKTFTLHNIIGSFYPDKTKRILLTAHWDTRPFADQEKDPNLHFKPIDGAHDGASGVAVLLEIARLLGSFEPEVGVDIIFFDLEDYGTPAFANDESQADSYCLGSQYWAKNFHVPNYQADFGILLDMVGAPNAFFTMEGTSMYYAAWVVQRVWDTAHKMGFGSFFKYTQTQPIVDDHLYINRIAKIPTIDIIQYDPETPSNFGKYWHTHQDNLETIDSQTLYAVGQTVLGVVFNYP